MTWNDKRDDRRNWKGWAGREGKEIQGEEMERRRGEGKDRVENRRKGMGFTSYTSPTLRMNSSTPGLFITYTLCTTLSIVTGMT